MSYSDIIENMFDPIAAGVMILLSIACWFGPVSFEVLFLYVLSNRRSVYSEIGNHWLCKKIVLLDFVMPNDKIRLMTFVSNRISCYVAYEANKDK